MLHYDILKHIILTYVRGIVQLLFGILAVISHAMLVALNNQWEFRRCLLLISNQYAPPY